MSVAAGTSTEYPHRGNAVEIPVEQARGPPSYAQSVAKEATPLRTAIPPQQNRGNAAQFSAVQIAAPTAKRGSPSCAESVVTEIPPAYPPLNRGHAREFFPGHGTGTVPQPNGRTPSILLAHPPFPATRGTMYGPVVPTRTALKARPAFPGIQDSNNAESIMRRSRSPEVAVRARVRSSDAARAVAASAVQHMRHVENEAQAVLTASHDASARVVLHEQQQSQEVVAAAAEASRRVIAVAQQEQQAAHQATLNAQQVTQHAHTHVQTVTTEARMHAETVTQQAAMQAHELQAQLTTAAQQAEQNAVLSTEVRANELHEVRMNGVEQHLANQESHQMRKMQTQIQQMME